MNHSRIELQEHTTLLVWEGVAVQQLPGSGRTTLSLRVVRRPLRVLAFRALGGALLCGLGAVLLVLSVVGVETLLSDRVAQAELAALMSSPPQTQQPAVTTPTQQAVAPTSRAPVVVRPEGAPPQRRDNAFGLLD